MAAATTDAAAAFALKLFIDTRARRVMFAEASRGAVDFLHSLAASVRLDDATRDACIGNLYDSVEALAAAATCSCCHCRRLSPPPPPGPQQKQQQVEAERFFLCGDKRGASCGGYVADRRGARCPSCGGRMGAEVPRGAPGAGGSGGQQQGEAAAGLMTCMLNDDLTVAPAPAGSFLAQAANAERGVVFSAAFHEAAAPFQEATVRLGHKEGLEILEASLRSSTVLTDVFLREKAVALQVEPSVEVEPSSDLDA